MNEIRIFDNPEFGEVRTVMIDDEPWFVGNDIATALGYARPRNALKDNVDEGDARKQGVLDSNNHMQQMTVINESGLYSLIFGSKLVSAKKFKRWVTSEVLPALRKTGTYVMPNSPLDVLELHYQAIKQVDRKVEAIDNRVDALRNELEQVKADMPIFGIEETRIVQAVHQRSIELMGGSSSNASKSKWMKKRVSYCIYRELHRVYGVKTYKALKRSQCDSVVEFINEYVLPEKMADQIEMCNAQVSLKQ